jgi:hypothetical protein
MKALGWATGPVILSWFLNFCPCSPSQTRTQPARPTIPDFQKRSNSVAWDQDRWRFWTVQLMADDVTHLAGYNARPAGSVQFTSADDIEPRKTPFGFTAESDTLTWTVLAPKTASYKIAVLYHSGDQENFGSRIVVTTGKSSASGTIQPVKTEIWEGGPKDRPSFRRDWLVGELFLTTGRNEITLKVLSNSAQIERAKEDLTKPTAGWPKRSLHIPFIELVRPPVWERMQADAPRLASSTRWMVEGKYGLFIHWVPESFPLFGNTQNYQEAVEHFDTQAFAEMVAQSGAAWVVFTTTHGKYYFPGPLHALDDVVAGRTCRRDLIAEIADALAKRHVRLMLYFHPGPGVSEDPEWAKAAGINPVNDLKNISIMLRIYREIGERYGQRLAGWFVDGGDAYYWRNFSFRQLELALKAGHRKRIVTFFAWIFPNFSPYSGDFLSDITDFGAPLPEPLPRAWLAKGGPYQGLQPQYSFTLEDEWYPDKQMNGQWPPPIYQTDVLVEYVKKMSAAKYPLTFNIVVTQDITRQHAIVSAASLDQMVAVRKAIRGN